MDPREVWTVRKPVIQSAPISLHRRRPEYDQCHFVFAKYCHE